MENIEQLLAQACKAVDTATSVAELEQVRVDYLGKKGLLTALLKGAI